MLPAHHRKVALRVRVSVGMLLGILFFVVPAWADKAGASRPNVLFIAIDDLNDWVGCLEGHSQVKTPHIDALARRGVSFTNAHCQAPICVPSRTSLLTGTYPWRNGVYMIEQNPREAPAIKDAATLPQYFRQHGYHTMGVGKIYHRAEGDADAWDQWGGRYGWTWMVKRVGPDGVSGLPNPRIFDFVPLLKDPMREWNYPALTTHHPGNHAVRTERWRYIRYANGDRELYDHESDPHEWHNLAGDPSRADVIERLDRHIPQNDAPYAPRLPRNTFTQEFDWSKP